MINLFSNHRRNSSSVDINYASKIRRNNDGKYADWISFEFLNNRKSHRPSRWKTMPPVLWESPTIHHAKAMDQCYKHRNAMSFESVMWSALLPRLWLPRAHKTRPTGCKPSKSIRLVSTRAWSLTWRCCATVAASTQDISCTNDHRQSVTDTVHINAVTASATTHISAKSASVQRECSHNFNFQF